MTTDSSDRALLPAGLRDVLPPQAAHEAEVLGRLMAFFAAHGYDRVKPPLIEFEESLLTGSGAAVAKHTFRVMDPVSHRMMGVRPDMTVQVARIATTRLAAAERPLRLSYAGQVLRVRGSQLRPERQTGQAGLELIGDSGATADAEVIVIAAKALTALGAEDVCVDLTVPTLVTLAVGDLRERPDLRAALDQKDADTVAALAGEQAASLTAMIGAAGPAAPALQRLGALSLPPAAAAQRDRLARVAQLVAQAAPDLALTIDPVENRGLEYHTGVAFSIFTRDTALEIGRGGRYLAHGEPATGATLDLDTLIEILPGPLLPRRIYLPFGNTYDAGAALRAQGWVTVAGLEPAGDIAAEARRLSCSHALLAGDFVAAV